MTQPVTLASTVASEDDVARLAIGILAAAEFADCSPDHDEMFPGISEADWSDEAREAARKAARLWLARITADDWHEACIRTPGHQDFDFDAVVSMGTDIYYGSIGHGVGFWDRSELDTVPGLGDRLQCATEHTIGSPYLGDDGLRYFE